MFGGGRLDAIGDLLGTSAEPMYVVGWHPCRDEPAAHFASGIVEYRFGIVPRGEHHMPKPRCTGRRRVEAGERRNDEHDAKKPGTDRHFQSIRMYCRSIAAWRSASCYSGANRGGHECRY